MLNYLGQRISVSSLKNVAYSRFHAKVLFETYLLKKSKISKNLQLIIDFNFIVVSEKDNVFVELCPVFVKKKY